ncbi:prolipoprotein diacylglyceryl transferase [Streptobacillus moniliformis]|uniref:prolipoprotein diacylglyceryl transferase n=1 Tax=Streptobacillus moniliformis TaxID=34105 RepID=UPI0007EEB456|nr:prolipoprotein diacylglyceryl transferase [Streptobacillus moniliformis]
MRPYLFKIGSFEIRIYSLMYIISLFLGIFVAKKDEIAKKRGIKENIIEDYAYFVIIAGLIGARIYYVLLKWGYYSQNLLEVFKVWNGGLAIHGGIIGGLIGTIIFAKMKNVDSLVLMDMAVGPLILGQGLGRIGNLSNGEIHGFPTITPFSVILKGNFSIWWQEFQAMPLMKQLEFKELVPWGLKFPLDTPAGQEFPNMSLHPAMIYEMILNFIAFYIIWFILRKKEYSKGILTMIYIITYGIIRIIVSTFRAEDLLISGIRAPYIVSLIMILAGIVGIYYFKNKNNKYLG